ncbi:hypothetical protein KUTeg_010611 [Tegillarca granosa]|uniref:Amine oxidase domain-containing protein n=1 Tax=Tegillarca granosa TaxID=220873 RepID=A0ABQ9F354_TEGGR|nr:hypothetical protein KUTeg_010611 [Tegillarca granosa]
MYISCWFCVMESQQNGPLCLKNEPKIVIIGAGISGLAAAEHLAKSGFSDFVILEASGRTGGRIYTVELDTENGQKIEMGANWIHGVERNPIFQIAEENNLLQLRHGDKGLRHRNIYVTESGEEANERIVNQVNLIYGQLIINAEDFFQSGIPTLEENDSVGAYLEREFEEKMERYKNGDKRIRELIFNQRKLLECCISGCDSLDDVSLSEFGGYEELPGVHYTIPPGFSEVLEIIKKKIPKGSIKLNQAVRSVNWNRKHSGDNQYEISVQCENGEIFYANHVICTVSLGVLKAACDRMFNPSLPTEKLQAIDRIGFGIVDKVILHFDEAITEPDVFRLELLWDSDNVEINDLRHTWYRKIYSFEIIYDNVLVVSHFCAHIKVCQILNVVMFPELYIVHSCMFIIAWLSGKEALYMESLTEEQVGQDLVEVLKKILRKTDIPQPSKVTR